MSRHLEKVLAHAEREPRPTLDRRKSFRFTRSFSASKSIDCGCVIRRRWRARNLRHPRLTRLMCCCVMFLLLPLCPRRRRRAPATPSACALGGYGRGELNPCSDVDVMFLHRAAAKSVPKSLQQIVEQVLYFLWDIGFKVGHSTRSLDEAIAQANGDMLTKTAMLEARFLAGDKELFQQFRRQFRAQCVQGTKRIPRRPDAGSGGAPCEICQQRLHAGTPREERMRRAARLPEPPLDGLIQGGCPDTTIWSERIG